MEGGYCFVCIPLGISLLTFQMSNDSFTNSMRTCNGVKSDVEIKRACEFCCNVWFGYCTYYYSGGLLPVDHVLHIQNLTDMQRCSTARHRLVTAQPTCS